MNMKFKLLTSSDTFLEFSILVDDSDIRTVMYVEETGAKRVLFYDYGRDTSYGFRATAIRQLIDFRRKNEFQINATRVPESELPSLCSRHKGTLAMLSLQTRLTVKRVGFLLGAQS